MKKNLLVLLAMVFMVYGCGGGSGGFVNEGDVTDPIGGHCAFVGGVTVCLSKVELYYKDYETNKTSNVDSFRKVCSETTGTGQDVQTITWDEYYADHMFRVELEAMALPSYREVPKVQYLVDSYTIDYVVSPDSFGSPMIEKYTGSLSGLYLKSPNAPNEVSTANATGVFVDLNRKVVFAKEINTGRYGQILPINYLAYLKLNMRSSEGTRFILSKVLSFSNGDFDNCDLNKPESN